MEKMQGVPGLIDRPPLPGEAVAVEDSVGAHAQEGVLAHAEIAPVGKEVLRRLVAAGAVHQQPQCGHDAGAADAGHAVDVDHLSPRQLLFHRAQRGGQVGRRQHGAVEEGHLAEAQAVGAAEVGFCAHVVGRHGQACDQVLALGGLPQGDDAGDGRPAQGRVAAQALVGLLAAGEAARGHPAEVGDASHRR